MGRVGSSCLRVVTLLVAISGIRVYAQTVNEPAWPQPFQILAGESASFGFVVTQPGPILVSATSQVPIILRLSGPLSQPVQQTGSGPVNLTYTATAADVQRSSLWLVRISTLNAVSVQQNRPPQVVATGNLRVQHPPSNASAALAEFSRRNAATVNRIPMKALGTAAALSAAYAQQTSSRQASQLQEIARRPISQAVLTSGCNIPRTQTLAAAGRPTILSVSVCKGEPGDPIRITGSGLTRGEVHFILNPGMDLKAGTNGVINDAQIIAFVPSITGIVGYQGQVYVEVAGVKSSPVPFEFVPTLEFVDLHPAPNDDTRIDPTDYDPRPQACNYQGASVCHNGDQDLLGHKGDDIFYATKVLKNGWIVHEANAGGTANSLFSSGQCTGQCGDAYVVDSRAGTMYPYLKVHWWMNALSDVEVGVVVIIKGPKGVPYW